MLRKFVETLGKFSKMDRVIFYTVLLLFCVGPRSQFAAFLTFIGALYLLLKHDDLLW